MTRYFKTGVKNRSVDNENKLNVMVESFMGGLHWEYENLKGDKLSVILHTGSYGGGDGLFEVYPSWRQPNEADTVEGYLTFGDVQRWIDELRSRG